MRWPRSNNYNLTLAAGFAGYMVQAIGNFIPLLFLTFQKEFGLSLEQLSGLIVLNFSVQMLVDVIGARYADRWGWRRCMVAAHLFSAVGLVGLTILPQATGSPYLGLILSSVIMAVGSGLLEVLVSPVVETCPTKNKAGVMSLLHSFYCWGYLLVVLVSTVFFSLFSTENWRVMALIWTLVPILNGLLFTVVPLASFSQKDGGLPSGMRQLFRRRVFWLLLFLMICAGACEQAVSQWASAFAESALRFSKTTGDLFGTMMFALLMGTSRLLYAKMSSRVDLRRAMLASGMLCLVSYLLMIFTTAPVLGLFGCALCGFSVGILWPGTFSLATGMLPTGGTAMFGLLALGGDIGCLSGPALVGVVSGAAGDDIRKGIGAAILFPVLLIAGLLICGRISAVQKEQ